MNMPRGPEEERPGDLESNPRIIGAGIVDVDRGVVGGGFDVEFLARAARTDPNPAA